MKKFLSDVLVDCNLTVSGTTSLGAATGITVASSDDSTNLATTAWVKNQGFVSTNTTYDISVPTGTTNIRLASSGGVNDDITISAAGASTVSRVSDSEIRITSSDSVDYISNVALAGTVLQFTGVGNGFAENIDLASINTDTNYYLNSATFNTTNGVLTLGRQGLTAITVDLDGRYLTSEADTLDTVTSRDGVTTNTIGVGTVNVTGSTEGAELLTVDGTYGRLFTVTDDLSDSLFSVNTVAGLPAFEVFADNTIKIGAFANPITIDSSSNISIPGTITASGYNDSNWNTAFNDRITAAAVSGTSTKTLTLTQGDGSTITASWTDIEGTGADSYVSDVALNGNSLDFTAVGSGFAGSIDLSGITTDLTGYATEQYVLDNSDDYGSWNLKTNGVQRTTVQSGGDLDIVAGTNVSVSYGAGGVVTISSTDTNTDTNNYLTGLSFNTTNGILTATRQGLGDLTVDLDGRFANLVHNHDTRYIRKDQVDTFTGLVNKSYNAVAGLDNGVILLEPGTPGGATGIGFTSRQNEDSDFGYLWWYDDNNNYAFGDGSQENAALILGIQNDSSTTSYGGTQDAIAIESSSNIFLNPGIADPINAGGTAGPDFTHGKVYIGRAAEAYEVYHEGNLVNVSQLNNDAGYLTSFTEADTLDTVTGRGATTANAITTGTHTISGTNVTGAESVLLQFAAGSDQLGSIRTYNSGGYNQHTRFYTSNVSGTGENIAFVYDHNGNFGIGTTSPSSKLHVAGGSAIPIKVVSSTFSGVESHNINGTWESFIGTESGGGGNRYNSKSSQHTFYNNSTAVMRINSSGNVGIGTTSPAGKLDVNGVVSLKTGSDSAYSIGVLEITSGGTPTQIKITTAIPFGGTTNAHSVTIKGFQYGSANTANLQISWHVYNNSFYSRTATSSGGWAPTIRLAVENGYVVIHLTSPGYWPKLYVESLYNAYGGTSHAQGWSWADAAINSDANTPNEVVPYKVNFGNSFVMDGSGNVGIGTVAPGQKLSVNGSLGVMTGTLYANDIAAYTGAMTLGPTGVSELKLRTASVERMRIDSSGNVGIGTTSPSGKLHIQTDASSKFIFTGASTSGYTTTFHMDNTGLDIGHNSTGRSLNLKTGSLDRLTITGAGNVGIGTTGPAQKLHVEGSVLIDAFNSGNETGIFFREGFYNYNVSILAYDHNGAGTTPDGISINGYDGVSFSTGSNTRNERMRITQSGNVGIGTTAPNQKLHVTGNLRLESTYPRIFLTDTDSSSDYSIINDNGTFTVYDDTNAGHRFRINSSGLIQLPAYTAGYLKTDASGNVSVDNSVFLTAESDTLDSVTDRGNTTSNSITVGGALISATAPILDFVDTNSFTDTDDRFRVRAVGDAGAIQWWDNSASAVVDLMRITSSGNVGIGTTSPNTFLHIAGQGNRSGGQIYLGNQDDGSTKYSLITSAHYNAATEPEGFTLITGLSTATENTVSIGGFVWESNPATDIRFFTHTATTDTTGGSERMRIISNGNVGIGTNAPASKLHVKGDVRIEGSHTLVTNAEKVTSTGGPVLIEDLFTNTAVFVDYMIYTTDLGNMRAGTFMAVTNGNEVRFTDTTTTDIGDTSAAILYANFPGASAFIYFEAPDPTWEIKYTMRSL